VFTFLIPSKIKSPHMNLFRGSVFFSCLSRHL